MGELVKDAYADAHLEQQVNELLIANGWDYDDRKRVAFMLRNYKPLDFVASRSRRREEINEYVPPARRKVEPA